MTIPLNNEKEPKSDGMTESKFLASRAKRKEALQAKRLQRRNNLDQLLDPDESMNRFMSCFSANEISIRRDLDDIRSNGVAITSAKRHQAEEQLDVIHALVRDLQLEASQSLSIKTAADKRKMQDNINILFQEVEGARKVVIPRKKFAFKNKRGRPTTKEGELSSAVNDGSTMLETNHKNCSKGAHNTSKKENTDATNEYFQREYADKSDCHIVLDNNTTNDEDGAGSSNNHFRLRSLNNCVVVL